jgi:uncharacterized protein YozE (UPF0346 family)
VRQSFDRWLREQRHRDDPVGDLARDVISDPDWPRGAGEHAQRRYLIYEVWACDGAVEAHARAWREYREQRGPART